MPAPGKWWRHVIVNTHGSWLHGDPRGFRSRGHRIHSSGDYKRPPPEGEHAGLYRHELGRAAPPIVIDADLRETVCRALANALLESGHRCVLASVGGRHAHVIVELPDNIVAVRAIVGDAKRVASRSVKQRLPGRIWSRGGEYRRIKDNHHFANAYDYVRDGQEGGARVWTSDEGERLRTSLESRYPRRRHGRKAPAAQPRRAE
jgi:hypothetical protein